MAEYKYIRDACQQDRPKGVTKMPKVNEAQGDKSLMSQRACTKGKLTLNYLCSPQVVGMQVWGVKCH